MFVSCKKENISLSAFAQQSYIGKFEIMDNSDVGLNFSKKTNLVFEFLSAPDSSSNFEKRRRLESGISFASNRLLNFRKITYSTFLTII